MPSYLIETFLARGAAGERQARERRAHSAAEAMAREGTRVAFNYPPTYRTIQETLKEVVRCTKDDIVINTFMLERGYYLADFVNQMTQLNGGRAFFAEPERLGEYILVDYVDHKRKTKAIR